MPGKGGEDVQRKYNLSKRSENVDEGALLRIESQTQDISTSIPQAVT